NPPDWQEILTYFRGSELQNYFTCILEDNLKVSLAVYQPEEQQERLKIIQDKFKEEINQHIQDCKNTLDDLQAYQIELKENAEKEIPHFLLGILYGAFLCLGGFLSFMLTGSISGIMFGTILGGALLALSISSMRSFKRGQSSALALKGEAVIAGILFLRPLRLFFQGPSFSSFITTIISGYMVQLETRQVEANGVWRFGQLRGNTRSYKLTRNMNNDGQR
ncbi:hypothetical protein MKW98_025813, partial [Papaver atlanticum]